MFRHSSRVERVWMKISLSFSRYSRYSHCIPHLEAFTGVRLALSHWAIRRHEDVELWHHGLPIWLRWARLDILGSIPGTLSLSSNLVRNSQNSFAHHVVSEDVIEREVTPDFIKTKKLIVKEGNSVLRRVPRWMSRMTEIRQVSFFKSWLCISVPLSGRHSRRVNLW